MTRSGTPMSLSRICLDTLNVGPGPCHKKGRPVPISDTGRTRWTGGRLVRPDNGPRGTRESRRLTNLGKGLPILPSLSFLVGVLPCLTLLERLRVSDPWCQDEALCVYEASPRTPTPVPRIVKPCSTPGLLNLSSQTDQKTFSFSLLPLLHSQ